MNYDGQYEEIPPVRIHCYNKDCDSAELVWNKGDVPDNWENLSKWGYNVSFCPDCKEQLVIRCTDPEVCTILAMVGAPETLDHTYRRAYEYRFDQIIERIKELKEKRELLMERWIK